MNQIGVNAIKSQQLKVAARLYNLAILYNDNEIRVLYSG
jgi:hypothetical protein